MTQPSDSQGQAEPGAQAPDQGKQATLSQELSKFLLELSIAVHRYGMYPMAHPSRGTAAANVVGRLSGLLKDRGTLSIGVAFDQLVIGGVPTDPNQPVLRDLAQRLHGHQVAAISFHRGVSFDDVDELLNLLASESEKGGGPVGLRPPEDLPGWEHIKVFPVGYDQVELQEGEGDREDGEPARATQLWIGLAQAALASEQNLDPTSPPKAGLVAESISRHGREAAYDQVIVGYLHQLAQEVSAAQGGEVAAVRNRLSELIEELDADTLRRLVEMGGDFSRRRKFVLEANQSLALESVVKIVTAAAGASERQISGSLTRLLSKLAVHAERGPGPIRARADTALRENVEELISGWAPRDGASEEYELILDAMARASPVFSSREEDGTDAGASLPPEETGAGRLLSMALEVDAMGPMVEKAVTKLLGEDHLGWILQALDEAPEGNSVAAHFEERLSVPERLSTLLSGEDVDEGTLQSLVERVGPRAVDPLMEALAESDARSIRRKVFDCLVSLDAERFPVAQRAAEKLDDPRWYVKRNMLGLLQEVDASREFSGLEYLKHDEPRVRREALALAIRNPEERDQALEVALRDPDERLVRMALLDAQESGLGRSGAEIVCQRFIEREELPGLRSLAVRVLAGSDDPGAMEGLVKVSLGGRTWWGRRKLAVKSPVLLLALGVLAERWSQDDGARPALKLARRSKDPEIQAAVAPGDPT